ncbi:MAG: DsrE family protein [Chloroflexi bacterium]|nr:DsrE family protein [Chloroflexota bacterium]
MASYLLVNSRDLHEYVGARSVLDLAAQLRARGNPVTLFLVENAVFAARQGSRLNQDLEELTDKGVRVVAEDVALRARGITTLSPAVAQSNIDELADLVVDGSDKVIWY